MSVSSHNEFNNFIYSFNEFTVPNIVPGTVLTGI